MTDGTTQSLVKILYPFAGETVGGSHLSTLTLIEALPKDRFLPIILLHKKSELARYLEQRGLDYFLAEDAPMVSTGSLINQTWQMRKVAAQLGGILKRNHIDIVHTNDGRMHATWAIACRLAGCPQLWHQRSADNSRRLSLYAKMAAAVVTISDHCRQQLTPRLARHVMTIYDPFDVETPVPDRQTARRNLCRELGVDEKTPLVGYVANLTALKRPLTFVDMAAGIAERFTQTVAFPMIGAARGGMQLKIAERIEETGGAGKCFLLGARFPIEPYMAAFDLLVAPAVNEGLGRTLIEAALAGTPIVAADHGGHREIIEDGVSGSLVEPDNPAAFAEAACELLEDRTKAEALSEQAKRTVVDRFATAKHVSAITQIYERIKAA